MDTAPSAPIPAQLACLADSEHRQVRRRVVNFAAVLEEHETSSEAVSVLDLSERGCRIRHEGEVAEGASLLIKFPGSEAMRATVVWSKAGEVGCEFGEELHPAAVEALITSAVSKRRRFGPGRRVFGLAS